MTLPSQLRGAASSQQAHARLTEQLWALTLCPIHIQDQLKPEETPEESCPEAGPGAGDLGAGAALCSARP